MTPGKIGAHGIDLLVETRSRTGKTPLQRPHGQAKNITNDGDGAVCMAQ